MSILDRIRRIAEANINSLLDRADTPEMELEAKIKELEEAITEAKEALAGFSVVHKRSNREREQLEAQSCEWQKKAEHALKEKDENSARRAVSERIKVDDRLGRLRPQIAKNEATYGELKGNLVLLHDRLKAARNRLSELRARQRAAEAQKKFEEKLDKIDATATNDAAFEKFEDVVFQTESEVEVSREIRGEISALEMEVEQEEHDAKVDAELAALRKGMEK